MLRLGRIEPARAYSNGGGQRRIQDARVDETRQCAGCGARRCAKVREVGAAQRSRAKDKTMNRGE